MRSRSAGMVVASLAIAACGLAPAPSLPSPISGDGVAGFGDSTPIELCLGPARVVSPDVATGAGSLCVGMGAQPTACSSDADCNGIENCVCGECVVEACEGGATCSNGRVCTDLRCTDACLVDTDCPMGEMCNAGGCARPCTDDSVCHFGERCDGLNNVCVTKVCSDAMPCAPGDTCRPETVAGYLHEPEVVTLDGADAAFVELRSAGPGTGIIYRATNDSLGRWTALAQTPLPPMVNGQGVGAPSVLVGANAVEMYFALGDGKAIGHAVSTDNGKTFTPDAAPVLVPESPWEAGWVGSPAAVRFQGATLLFYEGGPRAGVGLARIGPGGAVRVGSGPVVSKASVEDPLFWRDITEVGAPYALVVGDILRVYFTARGAEGSDAIQGDAGLPADANDSIGLAASRDGVTFATYPTGPVLARITNLRAYLGEREAAVRLTPGGGASITFVSTDAAGTTESGLATATQ